MGIISVRPSLEHNMVVKRRRYYNDGDNKQSCHLLTDLFN